MRGGAMHPCSGRLTGAAGRANRPRGAARQAAHGRAPLAAGAPPGGAAQSASGAGTCPAGIRIARGGRGTCAAGSGIRFVSLPDWPDRLNACALTIPCAGALPLGLSPSPRGRSEAMCIKPGTGCTAPQHGVCHPIPRPHHYATRATFSGPRFVSQKQSACSTSLGQS